MSGRRLRLVGGAPEAPQRALIATGHPVIALRGEDAAVTAFARALLEAIEPPGAVAALVPAHGGALDALRRAGALHVLAGSEALAAWLATLEPRTPIVCLGPAAEALAPTFRIALGRARNATAASSDLWLGYAHERVAKALGHVLTRAR